MTLTAFWEAAKVHKKPEIQQPIDNWKRTTPLSMLDPAKRISPEEMDAQIQSQTQSLTESLHQFKAKLGEKRKIRWNPIRHAPIAMNGIEEVPSDIKRIRMKLFKFCENRRPTYYGNEHDFRS